jgi:hypothetical protein
MLHLHHLYKEDSELLQSAGGGDVIIDAESTGSNEECSDITGSTKRKVSVDGIFPDNRSFTTSNNK